MHFAYSWTTHAVGIADALESRVSLGLWALHLPGHVFRTFQYFKGVAQASAINYLHVCMVWIANTNLSMSVGKKRGSRLPTLTQTMVLKLGGPLACFVYVCGVCLYVCLYVIWWFHVRPRAQDFNTPPGFVSYTQMWYGKIPSNICCFVVCPRTALFCCLNLHAGCLSLWGPDCRSWSVVARSTTMRNMINNAFGIAVDCVVAGNLMASRQVVM